MKNKILNFIEGFISVSTLIISIIAFMAMLIYPCYQHFVLGNKINHDLVTTLGVIFTACSAMFLFISKISQERIKYAIKLVEQFDNKDFREARNFTRAIKELWDSEQITPEKLTMMIEGQNEDKEIQDLMVQCKIEECDKLKESLIFLFNYWQKVYSGIQYRVADKKYILEHLSNVFNSQYLRFSDWFGKFIIQENDQKQRDDLIRFNELCEKHLKPNKFDVVIKKAY